MITSLGSRVNVVMPKEQDGDRRYQSLSFSAKLGRAFSSMGSSSFIDRNGLWTPYESVRRHPLAGITEYTDEQIDSQCRLETSTCLQCA